MLGRDGVVLRLRVSDEEHAQDRWLWWTLVVIVRPLESERGYRMLRRSPRWSEAGSLDYLRDVTYY